MVEYFGSLYFIGSSDSLTLDLWVVLMVENFVHSTSYGDSLAVFNRLDGTL